VIIRLRLDSKLVLRGDRARRPYSVEHASKVLSFIPRCI